MGRKGLVRRATSPVRGLLWNVAGREAPLQAVSARSDGWLRSGLVVLTLVTATGGTPAGGWRWRVGRTPTVAKRSVGRFHFTGEQLERVNALAKELEKLHGRLRDRLSLPTLTSDVHIHIAPSRAAMRARLRALFPDVADRATQQPALFVLRGGSAHVFVVEGPDLVRDLRHEFVHLVLNTTAPGLPLWLDEGLAEFFESPDAASQTGHVRLLEQRWQQGWRPDLGQLERLADFDQMKLADYAEAWAWADLLLHDAQLGLVLRGYLSDRVARRPGPTLRTRLDGVVSDPLPLWAARLADHLVALPTD